MIKIQKLNMMVRSFYKLLAASLLISVAIIFSGCSNPLQKKENDSVFLDEQIHGIEDYKSGTLSLGKDSFEINSSLSEIVKIDNKRFLNLYLYTEEKTCGSFASASPFIKIQLPENYERLNTFKQDQGEITYSNLNSINNGTFSQRIENAEIGLTVKSLIPPERNDTIEVELKHTDTIPRQFVKKGDANLEIKTEVTLGSKLCEIDSLVS